MLCGKRKQYTMLRSSDGKSKKRKGLFVKSFCGEGFALDWLWGGGAERSGEVLEDRAKQLERKY